MRISSSYQTKLLLLTLFLVLTILTAMILKDFHDQSQKKQSSLDSYITFCQEQISDFIEKNLQNNTPLVAYKTTSNMLWSTPTSEITAKSQQDYLAALTHYNNNDVEKALFYTEQIISRYPGLAPKTTTPVNPLLLARLLQYRIYRINFGKDDQTIHRQLIELLMEPETIPEIFLLEGVLTANQDLFSQETIQKIRVHRFFHQFYQQLEQQTRQDFTTSSPAIWQFTLMGTESVVLLHENNSTEILLRVLPRKEVEDFSTTLIKQLKKRGIEITLPILRLTDGENFTPSNLQFSGFNCTLNFSQNQLTNQEQTLLRNYFLLFLLAVAIYLLILASVWRYISALFRVQQIREDFLNILSHELKTPLAAIRLYADTLKDTTNPTEIASFTAIIAARTSQIERIITNMLYFNRLNDIKHDWSKKLVVNSEQEIVNISQLITAIVVECGEGYGKTHTLELPEQVIQLRGDARIIRIIFSNLIDNSFKYHLAEKVPFVVTTEQTTEKLKIDFTDGGVLKDAQMTHQIFTKYQQISDKNLQGGLGLGLHIVKRLVEAMGGQINCSQNDHLVFHLEFPLSIGKNDEK